MQNHRSDDQIGEPFLLHIVENKSWALLGRLLPKSGPRGHNLFTAFGVDAEGIKTPSIKKVPIIDVTDLYHPNMDVGDNFDLIAPYGLPEIDLRAVILDVDEYLRQPSPVHPILSKNPEFVCFMEEQKAPRDAALFPYCNSTTFSIATFPRPWDLLR